MILLSQHSQDQAEKNKNVLDSKCSYLTARIKSLSSNLSDKLKKDLKISAASSSCFPALIFQYHFNVFCDESSYSPISPISQSLKYNCTTAPSWYYVTQASCIISVPLNILPNLALAIPIAADFPVCYCIYIH